MLFLLNKTQSNTLELLSTYGAGNNNSEVLLISDAVYYCDSAMVQTIKELGVGEIYLLGESLKERNLEPSKECNVVDYDDIVSLIMDKHEKVITV